LQKLAKTRVGILIPTLADSFTRGFGLSFAFSFAFFKKKFRAAFCVGLVELNNFLIANDHTYSFHVVLHNGDIF